jgi:hypothetical protein
MVVTFDASTKTSNVEIWNRLDRELSSETKFNIETKFLVVLVLGGSKGRPDVMGDNLAKDVVDKIDSGWSHISKGTTFFDDGHDKSLEYGRVRLKLFPVLVGNEG